jgi:hypothetical protein
LERSVAVGFVAEAVALAEAVVLAEAVALAESVALVPEAVAFVAGSVDVVAEALVQLVAESAFVGKSVAFVAGFVDVVAEALVLVAESAFVAEYIVASVVLLGHFHILNPLVPVKDFVPPQLVSIIWPRVHSVRSK